MPIEFNDENKFSEYLHDLLRLTSTQQRALGQGYRKIIDSVNALYCHMENLSAKDTNGKIFLSAKSNMNKQFNYMKLFKKILIVFV